HSDRRLRPTRRTLVVSLESRCDVDVAHACTRQVVASSYLHGIAKSMRYHLAQTWRPGVARSPPRAIVLGHHRIAEAGLAKSVPVIEHMLSAAVLVDERVFHHQ